ncbi:hypothetical protein BDD41_2332 [Paracoccus versutus]|uniref:Uncharacterized protein n=1 Tax=Paracoccus versutus TaxID=34007 RepID=A0A3D9XNA1_PARVE|nr:hypothetical protein BDD41_2332 [Paracoccus versutus]
MTVDGYCLWLYLLATTSTHHSGGTRCLPLSLQAASFLMRKAWRSTQRCLRRPKFRPQQCVFFSTISRVADLALWTHERVRSTFKEDVKAKLEASLPEGVTMEIDGVPDDRVKDLRADVVLRSPGVAPVALYLVQSDVPLFEAMLLKSETKGLPGRPRVAALLEKEQSGTAKTRLRAVNRLDAWAIYAGEDDSAVERIREELQHPALN